MTPIKLSRESLDPRWHPSAYVYVPGCYVLHELRDIVRMLTPGTIVTVLCENPLAMGRNALYDGWTYTVPEDTCT